MPTSLSDSYSAKIVEPARPPRTDIWLIVVWAMAMLLFGALANMGAETGALDPFQLHLAIAF